MNKEIRVSDLSVADKLTVSSAAFVEAMAAAAFGVSIVTTAGQAGRFGLTVSAVSSVSAEPPLLLACINRKNVIENAIIKNQRFAVNFLSNKHVALARSFAGRPVEGPAYDFDAAKWNDVQTMPVLQDATANFICDLESYIDAGTHRIFIGRVTHAMQCNVEALVYSNRTFGKFTKI